jgi:hypothetical protein
MGLFILHPKCYRNGETAQNVSALPWTECDMVCWGLKYVPMLRQVPGKRACFEIGQIKK